MLIAATATCWYTKAAHNKQLAPAGLAPGPRMSEWQRFKPVGASQGQGENEKSHEYDRNH